MKCENMNNGERPTVLFIFAYQILVEIDEIEMRATPKGRGLPQEKEKNGQGLPQEKEKNGRGLPQEKKKCIWLGLP